jgi:hypothetical protein
MSKFIWKSCLGILAMGASLSISSLAQANENKIATANKLAPYNNEDRATLLAQVTSISQFRDVSPNVWAFEALRNLVDEYGCIEGYPDGSYRGDRALTRYEFAAGMNACLEAFERRLLEGKTTATQQTTPATVGSSRESLAETFERAFFDNMDSFYESTDPIDQLNTQLGIIPFKLPAAFPENEIARDAKLVNILYTDAMKQQSSLPPVRTRDLPNPFDTSLRENPNYIRPAIPGSSREVIIEQR